MVGNPSRHTKAEPGLLLEFSVAFVGEPDRALANSRVLKENTGVPQTHARYLSCPGESVPHIHRRYTLRGGE